MRVRGLRGAGGLLRTSLPSSIGRRDGHLPSGIGRRDGHLPNGMGRSSQALHVFRPTLS